jgi:hypothetical protein
MLYDPIRLVHLRLEGKRSRPLCGRKRQPGIRPKMLPRTIGIHLPPPIPPDGDGPWGGTCPLCYEKARQILPERSPLAAQELRPSSAEPVAVVGVKSRVMRDDKVVELP